MELDLYCFADVVHASGFFGQNTGVLQLDTVAQVHAVFCHIRFLGAVETCVSGAL
jgi:hypothetical protein